MYKKIDIKKKYQWDLTSYFKNENDCIFEMEYLEKNIKKIEEFKNKLNNEKDIFECLKLSSYFLLKMNVIAVYLMCRLSEDSTNTKIVELNEKINNLFINFNIFSNFINTELNKLSVKKLIELKNNKKYSQFSVFFKNIIKNRKLILSDKEELIISKIDEFSHGSVALYNMFDSADIKFKKVKDKNGKMYELTFSSYLEYIKSSDKILRKNSFVNFLEPYVNFQNALAINYINIIKENNFYSNIRNFKSTLKRILYFDDIDEKIFSNLIKKVNDNLDIIHNYFDIKRKILNLPYLKNCDVISSVGEMGKIRYSFEQAVEISLQALRPLGEEYLQYFKRGVKEKWIDVYERKNEYTGQFSTCAFSKNPIVFLKYCGDYYSIETLMHEMGHAINFLLSNQNQPFEKSDVSSAFLAEIASTVNELLLINYLLQKSTSKQEKIFYFDQFFIAVFGSIYRQTQFSEFEQKVFSKYEKDKILSKEFLINLYKGLCEKYYGKNVKLVKNTEFEFFKISYLNEPFYAYSYSTGLICAIKIVNDILKHKDNACTNYIRFLSSGSSRTPNETLKIVGIDLTKEDIFDEIFANIKLMQKEYLKILNI